MRGNFASRRNGWRASLAGALLLLSWSAARAVILFDTGAPSANTTAPANNLAGSGWQYEGIWGGFLGTPIAPHFFISAAHIGQAGANLVFQGSTYTIVQSFSLPGSDFLIWQVKESFPSFAPLYTHRDEVAQHLVVIGRGTQRGSEMTLDGTLRGWAWGPGDGVERWGENDVAEIVPYNGHDLLYATFDKHVQMGDHPNESHLSSGDSGGAIFLKDNSDGLWKLAAINYAVDDLYTPPTTPPDPPGLQDFAAAIYDSHGYYTSDGQNPPTYTLITDPIPTGFYGSRISSELAWIGSVIADPQVGREGNFLTLTYSRLLLPDTELTYTVEQSDDLVTWTTATTEDEILSTSGNLQTVKVKIDAGDATRLFAHLKVTRPVPPATSSPGREKGAPTHSVPRALPPLSATSARAAYRTDSGR